MSENPVSSPDMRSKSLNVSPFSSSDESGLVSLLQEMQLHYHVPCPDEVDIRADLRSLPNGVTLLVARTCQVVGIAALAAVWPGPGLRRGLFLKELYVKRSQRGRGVGRALMQAAVDFAVENGFERLDWTADRDDAPLLAFYRRLDALEMPDKLFFRLSGHSLRASTMR